MSERQSIVFLSGLCDDATMWNRQVDALAPAADTLALDLVRHETVADSAAWVLDQAPDSFALVGFSMGGYVAFEILRQAPARVGQLALLSSSARPDSAERRAARLANIDRVAAGDYEALIDELIPQVVNPGGPYAESVADSIRAMAWRIGQDAFVRQLRVCMDRPDSRPDLARIACPTLVVCGRDDRMTPPEQAEEMARGIAGAELLLIDDCNHYTPMERPEIVSAALRRWLEEN